MYGSRFNKKSASSRYGSSEEKSRKKENLCKIYGHTAGKIRAGNSTFCSSCGKRFCAN